MEACDVRIVSKDVGMGLFANRHIPNGSVVFEDRPFVSIQHTANRRFIRACQNCHKCVGSVRDQFETIFQEDRFSHVDLTHLPHTLSHILLCDCGETYCSQECLELASRKHHRNLCVAGFFGESVAEFKYFCLSVEGCGDNLLLLAQLLVTIANEASGQYDNFLAGIREILSFTNEPFEKVARPPSGCERDAEWEQWLSSTLLEAFELLSRALFAQDEVFAKFFSNKVEAFHILSRLLSVFELNNIDIAIPSTLAQQVSHIPVEAILPILQEKEVVMRALWNDESRGVYEDDEEEGEDDDEMEYEEEEEEGDCCGVDEMIGDIRKEVSHLSVEEIVGAEYPQFHGSGFYRSVARTNHSCTPSVVMNFEHGSSLVSCRALTEISPGEELRMSYISNPREKSFKTRQNQLNDYGFTCVCPLCSAQAV